MRRLLGFLALLAVTAAMPGCLSYKDRDHNRQHRVIMSKDAARIHRDVDHMFKWHEPSDLIDREEPY